MEQDLKALSNSGKEGSNIFIKMNKLATIFAGLISIPKTTFLLCDAYPNCIIWLH